MTTHLRPLFLILAVPALALLLVAAQSAQQGKKVEGLLQERLITLVKLEELVRKQHLTGLLGLEEVIRATMERHEAELALAGTKEERVAILQRELDAASQLEAHIAERIQAGVAPEREALRVRALWLEVAIELERAR